MRWSSFAFISFLTTVLAGGWACDHKLPPGSPSGGGVTIGAFVTVGSGGGSVFAPSSVTITHGTAVVFYYESGFHTVNVDDGQNAGTCADYTVFESASVGTAVTQIFTAAGTFPFHCDIHSDCGGASSPNCNVVCTTMTGTVSVQ